MNISVRLRGKVWQARVRYRGADGLIHEKHHSLSAPSDKTGRGKKTAMLEAEKWVKDAGFVEIVEQSQATRLDCSQH